MIEWLAFPVVLLAVALIPQREQSDEKKIQMIFKNIGYGIQNQDGEIEHPRFRGKVPIKVGNEVAGIIYRFKLPLGLAPSKMVKLDQEYNLFADGLGKNVITGFNRDLGFFEVKVLN